MNSKGQIIITDLIFYLIIITAILSILIYSFAVINDSQVENIEIANMNQVLEDVTGTLMTPGIPYNWHETGNVEQVGLSVNNSSDRISYQKVMRLNENPELLGDYFPAGIMYSIYLEPLNKSEENITIADTGLGKNVYQKTRNVVMDYGYESLLIKNVDCCPLNHTDNYTCGFINVNRTGLNEGKYYLVSENGTTYLLSNTYNEIITGDDTELNSNMNILLHGDGDTIHIHIPDKKNTYIVYDKFNQKDKLYSVLEPDIYTLHIEAST